MARIRTVKPEFWKHEDLSDLPEATHLLAAALLNYADDEGYFNAHPGLIKAECLPLREPSVSVHESLEHMSRVGFIRLGNGEDGKRYGQIVTFLEHQRINRPSPSKIKKIGIVWDGSPEPHPQITETSHPERNREQGKEHDTPHKPPASEKPQVAKRETNRKKKLTLLEAIEEHPSLKDGCITRAKRLFKENGWPGMEQGTGKGT